MIKDYFTIEEIAKITKAVVSSTADDSNAFAADSNRNASIAHDAQSGKVRYLLTDSRRLQNPENTLFVALQTKKDDGHKYIGELYEKGVRFFLVQHDDFTLPSITAPQSATPPLASPPPPKAIFLKVKNTLKALQQIAEAHRKQFNIPVLAITGSNGKTIVKEWISTLLQPDKQVVKSPKSYNSQTGVPLSVWGMKEGDEFAVFEAGISEPNEMDALQKIIHPTIGIFTNVGSAHDGYFLDKNQKTAEKLKLFTNVSLLIFCADYLEIREQMSLSKKFKQTKTFLWTTKKNINADVKIQSIDTANCSAQITALYNEKTLQINIPFTDNASIENAIHCWVFMLSQGYENEEIARRLQNLHAVEMRMEMKEGVNNCFIINDFYNFDYNSLVMAVTALANQNQNSFRRIIISDMLQSGRNDSELYKEISTLLKQKNINAVTGIGERISAQRQAFDGLQATFYTSTENFLKQANTNDFHNETILLKGARSFGFERISRFFQKKVHQTVFEISLNAIANNLNVFRSLVKPSTKIMLMTKAFSYGAGSYEIANMLHYHHADYLAVAYADEGVQLRQNGVTIPIMVMNSEEQGLNSVLQYNLEPEIYSMEMLRALQARLLAAYNLADSAIKIHIKLNTGMNRLGFSEDELPELLRQINADTRIKVASTLTHLATADEPQNDKYTLAQLEKFEKMSSTFASGLSYPILRHCLNTAGIIRFPQYQYDMVRLGIGLYGVDALEDTGGGVTLENVGTLKTVISQIHTLQKGEAVGYGRKFIAQSETRTGVIGIGYADGFNRRLGNGVGEVVVRGKRVPIIGNVCMDMCMVDLTAVPDAQEQDEVVVFGKEIPVTEIARKSGTIPYEILTGISSRVKRIYFQE
ncbi:MAG: bifunctional UDP-N-acetylmuramoyl-tripeptide:D-alanyl-D-alanine ligase/alanine racemase [Bacteroidales bacterium]|jgi:alanine racemase|nr:bifunctional UDP-N-acetylmuramoyl-tripeptide:D-alanyl-D-alanine ligase/alanine racemase [Bacteroidales bacterium]